MMRRLFHWQARRPLAAMFIGVALGAALFGAPVATGGSAATATYTRAISCAGLDFYPFTSGITYGVVGTARNGSGDFLCNPSLPNKAVVTRVAFALYDNSTLYEVSNCALVRASLKLTGAFTHDVMASVPGTGDAAAPFQTRLVDTSINFATVDNTSFGYWLQCSLEATSATGIVGASVSYTISATNG